MSETSKKFGGQERADAARKALSKIFSKPKHPLYFEKDISLAQKFDVSRLTVYSIRDELGIPSRSIRILNYIKKMGPENYTIQELADLLDIKYQNMYKIVNQYGIKVKPDVRPVDTMNDYLREKKEKSLSKDKKTSKLERK